MPPASDKDTVSDRYDVIVVGSGAAGGWAAKELSERGFSVLVLEAGPLVAAENVPEPGGPRPRDAIDMSRQRVQSQHPSYHAHTRHLFVDDVDHPYTTAEGKPFVWIRGRQIGGRTLTWGGVTLRMSDYDLKAASRDGVGDDWPISYEDLRPAYDRVESFLGVAGSVENLPQLPDGKFLPPSPITEAERTLKASLESRWPERRLIPCRGIVRRKLHGWPSLSSQGTTLAAALATGRCTVRANAIATRILTQPGKARANGVLVVDADTGEHSEARGRAVILCASTIETTRLLLNSASPDQPNGLGNSSGVLGRYLMDHPVVLTAGIATKIPRELCTEPLSGPHSVLVPRFDNLEERHAAFVRGYALWGGIQRDIPDLAPESGRAPFVLVAACEMLPRIENRVTIDPGTRDRWGVPAVRIDCTLGPNEEALVHHGANTVRELARMADLEIRFEETSAPLGRTVHEVGTARMGDDPKTSVLNPFNQCWDVENLFVTDGACFVSCGWQNPTLTVMALTVRACGFIAQELGPPA